MNLLVIASRIAAADYKDDIEIPAKRGYRQEYWVFPNKKVVDVETTHGQKAVEILEERGDKVPMQKGQTDIPDFMEAMKILFKEGAARVHRFGDNTVVSVNKFTSKILDAITDFLIDKNVDLNNNIKLQYGGIGAFKDMTLPFKDLLEVGNDPRKLEKKSKVDEYKYAFDLFRIAARVAAANSTPIYYF